MAERALGEDRGDVLGRRGHRETQRWRRALLEPIGDALVATEELIDLEPLRPQDGVEVVVRVCVATLLAEEALDLGTQRRILDLAEEVLHRAHEEALAVWEQQVDPVTDRGRRNMPAHPVARHAGQIVVEVSRFDVHETQL